QIRDGRAIVGVCTQTILVGVVQGIMRAAVAGISEPIGIGILLARVWHAWTIVYGADVRLETWIPQPILVGVRTGIASIPTSVTIRISLGRIVHIRTIVRGADVCREAWIAEPIAVGV